MFNVGDRVEYIGDSGLRMNPVYYPTIGTVGVVTGVSHQSWVTVQCPQGSTSRDDEWLCRKECIVLADQSEDFSTDELDKFLSEFGGAISE